jgi:hypothetical protein
MRHMAAVLFAVLASSAQAETPGWIWKELTVSPDGYVLRQGGAEFENLGERQMVHLVEDGGKPYAVLSLTSAGDVWKASLRHTDSESVIELEGSETGRSTDDKCETQGTAMFQEAFVLTNGWTTLHLMVAYCDR